MITDIMDIYELEKFIDKKFNYLTRGILFCFGTSFISRIISAKTRKNVNEYVPTHVALLTGDSIYESTTDGEEIGYKKIRSGVRRWQLKDYITTEKNKLTKYVYVDWDWDVLEADEYIHLPYGKDTILDFLLKDGSDGDSHGLICSQYANICTRILPKKKCPNPAELYREVLKKYAK